MEDALIDLVSLNKDTRHHRDPDFVFFDEEPEPEAHAEVATVLRFLLTQLSPTSAVTPYNARITGTKLFLAGWMLGIGAHASKSLAQLARQLGCTRAILSHHVKELESAGFPHARGQKQLMASAVFSQAQKRAWRTRPRKLARKPANGAS
jgi:hypothetical protein